MYKRQEKQRLSKEEEKLEKAITAREKKLSNENFVSRAPAEVVAQERDLLTEMQRKLASIKANLADLSKA